MDKEKKAPGKRKKPSFARTDAHKKKRLGDSWRRPRGYQNKRRLHKKGYAPVVKIGYGSPKVSRAKSRTGLELVMVSNLKDLESIDKKTQCAIISANLGAKKKLIILQKAKELGISINNFVAETKIKEIKDSLESKKKKKQNLQKKKEDKKKSAKKEAEKEKKEEEKKEADKKKSVEDAVNKEIEEKTDEKDKEKKDFDKLLTKKQ